MVIEDASPSGNELTSHTRGDLQPPNQPRLPQRAFMAELASPWLLSVLLKMLQPHHTCVSSHRVLLSEGSIPEIPSTRLKFSFIRDKYKA